MAIADIKPTDPMAVIVGNIFGDVQSVPGARFSMPVALIYPIGRGAAVAAIPNPLGAACMVSAAVNVKTANGSALTVDIGIDNAPPHTTTSDTLIDAGGLNAAGLVAPGSGTNGDVARQIDADGAVVTDLSAAAAAPLVADVVLTFTPI